jgi:hypothetical protein
MNPTPPPSERSDDPFDDEAFGDESSNSARD